MNTLCFSDRGDDAGAKKKKKKQRKKKKSGATEAAQDPLAKARFDSFQSSEKGLLAPNAPKN